MSIKTALGRPNGLRRSFGRLACAFAALPVAAATVVAVPAAAASQVTPGWIMAHVTSAQPWATIVRSTLADWYLAPGGSKVVIGLTRITSTARSAARTEFGSAAELIQAAQPIAAVGHGTATRIVRTPSLPAAPQSGTGNRRADRSPFYGGDEIISYYKISGNKYRYAECTSSWDANYTVRKWNVMVTAGHCDGTHTFRTWYSGYVAGGVLHIGAKEGSLDVLSFGNYRSDAMTLTLKARSGTYAPHLFVGAVTSSRNIPVTGSAALSAHSIGERICTDGVVAGPEVCGPKIISVNLCAHVKDRATGVQAYVCHLALAQYTRPFCTPGNSGGPVFLDTGHATGAMALGTIEGYSNKGKTYYCYINELPNVLASVHAKLGRR
jgi:hypothetical protein